MVRSTFPFSLTWSTLSFSKKIEKGCEALSFSEIHWNSCSQSQRLLMLHVCLKVKISKSQTQQIIWQELMICSKILLWMKPKWRPKIKTSMITLDDQKKLQTLWQMTWGSHSVSVLVSSTVQRSAAPASAASVSRNAWPCFCDSNACSNSCERSFCISQNQPEVPPKWSNEGECFAPLRPHWMSKKLSDDEIRVRKVRKSRFDRSEVDLVSILFDRVFDQNLSKNDKNSLLK